MSITVLPQLQTVEAELLEQESQLATQLEEARKKLRGLQAVISMFSESTDAASATTVKESPSPEETAIEDSEEETTASKPAKSSGQTKKTTTQKKAAQKKTTAKAKAPAKKKDGRAATWQKYARPGVKNQSMPDAVRLILETQPKNEFKIADVMDALFEEKMPRAQYLKARNRISNVLSGGVRAGDWHKGDRGTYRMTKA